MKLPTTRRACAKLYRYRRLHNRALTKLDMYLGGMICCSEEEFLWRKPMADDLVIGGVPCMCINYEREDYCHEDCIKNAVVTLKMPWDAPL